MNNVSKRRTGRINPVRYLILAVAAIMFLYGLKLILDTTVFLTGDEGADFQTVFVMGDDAPETSGQTFAEIYGPELAVNNAGELAFDVYVTRPGDSQVRDAAIFRKSGDTVTIVAKQRTQTPLGDPRILFDSFHDLGLNAKGDMSFGAILTGEGIRSRAEDGKPANHNALFVESGETFLQIARAGEPVPGLEESVLFRAFDNFIMNDKGNIVVIAFLDGPGVTKQNDMAIVTGTADGLSVLARTGSLAPGGGEGRFSRFFDLALNNNGIIAFTAALVGVTPGAGLFTHTEDGTALVLKDGDEVPGLSDKTFFRAFGRAPNSGVKHRGLALNDKGDLLFVARLTGKVSSFDNRTALFKMADGPVEIVAQSGKAFDPKIKSYFADFRSVMLDADGTPYFFSKLLGPDTTAFATGGIFWRPNLEMMPYLLAREQAYVTAGGTERRIYDIGSNFALSADRRLSFSARFYDQKGGVFTVPPQDETR
ncbi:MAG: choice-of-anchor tandem repeat NxxGxxAF-containing protein [Pseudomonadota bacterium]